MQRPRITTPRAWCYRLLAVTLGLIPFVLVDCSLRLAGWGDADAGSDPFVGFHAIRPLFALDDDGRAFRIPPSRGPYFASDAFPAEKGKDAYRVFCLGGSTVQGHPYSIETSFTTWLEIALRAADPRRDWQVINCGGVSYATYRLAPILSEVLDYEPDLIVLYAGHNEFLEDRSYAAARGASRSMVALHGVLSHWRLYQVARQAADRWFGAPDRGPSAILPEEVDALLDYRGGLAHYHRDDAWAARVMDHFALNVDRMARMTALRRVPMIVIEPVTNLRDCPPFKYETSSLPDADERDRFEWRWNAARDASDPEVAAAALREALRIDARHAGAHYYLARCLETLGRVDEARAHYIQAKDEDLCPLRIREPMYAALEDVAHRRAHVRLIDIRPIFESMSRNGIPGDDVMADHVHPRIEGHQWIAQRLVEELEAMGVVRPGPDWESARRSAFRAHLETLDEVYFARGRMRLEGLRLWSQGRAAKIGNAPVGVDHPK
ncbi:MAG: SGNH/GDSL hydrolase family protein [Planctomycetes bacterium]|nr:SGNH/GDSL hydrolase family protein [Planctomycetota bacterium]